MPKLKPNHISPEPAKVELTQEQFDEIAASDMSFDEIATKYGEEVAIYVGIARDPDTSEADEGWFARARPAIEAFPDLVEGSLRRRCQEQPSAREYVTIPIDNDLIKHFLDDAGPDWHIRLNDTLRQAVFGLQDP